MASFCLIPQAIDRFKQALTNGEITPEKLSNMTSDERHQLFSGLVGEENAKGVNSLFESKLLLKNQQQGMVTWAKNIAGLKPEVRRDIISRIEKMDRVLDPAEHEQFLKDLASTKLGVNVTQEEAKKIADLSKAVTDTRTVMENGGDRLAHGNAQVELGRYVSDLKHEANKATPTELLTHPTKAITNVGNLSKSLKATLDVSALFRQGWKTLITNPGIWQKNARKVLADIPKSFSGKDVMKAIDSDILTRPNYARYKKAGLATSTIEEAFPSSFPEKIPGIGRVFKASEDAYTGFLHRQRADVFDKYIEIAQKHGVNIDDPKQLKSIGKLVNSLTGRGDLGRYEGTGADLVNSVFFSPRLLKSNLDTLTAHQFQKNVTPFVRRKAAEDTLKIVGATAAILAVANSVLPGSVELDPRSADFGKIRVGNTRFDVTGGMGSITTLAARLLKNSTKNSTTGVVSQLGNKFGQSSRLDVATNYLEGKLSPAGSVVKDLLKGQDMNGKKPSLKGEVQNAFEPLPITTYQELKNDPNSANDLVGLIADGIGINTNTYGQSNTDWSQNPTKELTQFEQKIGAKQFKVANDSYNQKIDDYIKSHKQDIKTSADVTTEKNKIKQSIFSQYGFKYQKKAQ